MAELLIIYLWTMWSSTAASRLHSDKQSGRIRVPQITNIIFFISPFGKKSVAVYEVIAHIATQIATFICIGIVFFSDIEQQQWFGWYSKIAMGVWVFVVCGHSLCRFIYWLRNRKS